MQALPVHEKGMVCCNLPVVEDVGGVPEPTAPQSFHSPQVGDCQLPPVSSPSPSSPGPAAHGHSSRPHS